jgi:hypothetical protein
MTRKANVNSDLFTCLGHVDHCREVISTNLRRSPPAARTNEN